ncbi:MAG: hypothetical protein CFE26_07210 [Verrucomicrobiales bacterium VVV1]|nr:MAG: hypothetical protein CFE26_07210 [Verrucomicrobiales bacterium VVV1]
MSRRDELQREFFSVLQLPLRGASRRATDLPPSEDPHSTEFFDVADRIIKPGPSMSSAERLELYHRQYWYRLLDSIAEDFPLLIRVMGAGRFWALIEDYLLACPSTSFTLRHLGERLPGFLQAWESATECERAWFCSIARLEYARMEVFERSEYRPILPSELATEELILQPHVVRLSLPAPADECEEWEGFEAVEVPEQPTLLAVWRTAERLPQHVRLSPIENVLLDRLAAGGTLDSIFSEPVEPEPSDQEVATWFAGWQDRGWIAVKPRGAEEVEFVRGVDADSLGDGVDKMGSQARSMD